MDNNVLDYNLAKSVGEFFRLDNAKMDQIIEEIITPVKNWRKMAKNIGIPNNEQKLMAKAFRV
jgi:serine/threonine-protein kinase HipA